MDARTDAHTRTDNVKTVYPPQTKFAGGIIRKPIIILIIQQFEADFQWKVSLKILNSGIVLKTFTHALWLKMLTTGTLQVNNIKFGKSVVCLFSILLTAVIWKRGHTLKSHPIDLWSRGLSQWPLVYKASGLSATTHRLIKSVVHKDNQHDRG